MSERPRLHLHTFGAVRVPAGPPSVDEARVSLGGRASTSDDAGKLVHVDGDVPGVVVFSSESACDVWIGDGRLRRVPVERCTALEGPAPDVLAAVAADAARFAALREGTPVRYLDRAGRAHEGTLVEKCRYGALVATNDERVLAVSFRRIAPAAV